VRTAFPWAPACRWQREDRPGRSTVWHVTVTDPSPESEGMRSISGKGDSPAAALDALLDVAGWWLGYDGRQGATMRERYIGKRA
jgi:hypothetical protein